LNNEDAVLSVMKRLKRNGASFALDDFGTGYSSLTYLRRFPFDTIKIDKSFIADIGLTVNATIVHAVASIGRSLGLKVVAEGVEEAAQQQFLVAAESIYFKGIVSVALCHLRRSQSGYYPSKRNRKWLQEIECWQRQRPNSFDDFWPRWSCFGQPMSDFGMGRGSDDICKGVRNGLLGNADDGSTRRFGHSAGSALKPQV